MRFDLDVSKYGQMAILLMVLSIGFALTALLLPWFQFSQTDTETSAVYNYSLFHDHWEVSYDNRTLSLPYSDGSYLEYMMNVETFLIAVWSILGLGFIYSILRDDAALSILTGTILPFVGGSAILYFSSMIADKVFERVYMSERDEGLWGSGVDYSGGVLYTWGPDSGWYVLLSALALALAAEFTRLVLDRRK